MKLQPLLFATAMPFFSCALLAQENHNDPAAELASFKIAEGFEVNLFASEKDGIIKPIIHRIDRFGRVWVIGSTTYPQIKPGEEPNDYVKVIEDTNGDGKADKVTTFADGLMIPTGLELDVDGRGCWVGEGTKLWHMRDEDGDDKADRKEIVLRGFGTGDNHQNINSFRWSPGGELMMSQGLHAFSRVETPYGITKLDEAGYFRFRPSRQQLDAFWGGPADPQNPWGFAWDEWGAMFVQAGNNGGLFDALPSAFVGGVAKRPPSVWEGARGRKCSNPEFVGTAHFPPNWQGRLIVPGYINNAVWTLELTPDGSGWKARDVEPLITSTHGSFRPMDAKFGPDGALYITDWYNPIIGHYQASFRHPDRDKQHGRIWRVTAKGRPLVKAPEFLKGQLNEDKGDAAKGVAPTTSAKPLQWHEVLEGLGSGERFVREQSRRMLAKIARESSARIVEDWALRQHTDAALFQALTMYEQCDEPNRSLLKRCLSAKEPRLRAYAIGVAMRWAADLRILDPNAPSVMTDILRLAKDPEPRVRLAAIVAAGNASFEPAAGMLILQLAATLPTDARIDFARTVALQRLKPYLGDLPEDIGKGLGKLDAPGSNSAAQPANAPKADPKLATMVSTALKQPSGSGHIAPEAVAAMMAEVREKGDAKRGREIFRRAELACVACHRVGEEGGQLGPDLSNIGSAQPLDFIIGAVLEPQREVKEGFETREVTMKDGRVVIGFRRAAEPGEVSILDAASQREVRLPKTGVVSEKTLGSMMPAGLIDRLPRDEQRDLFRFLSELGRQR